MGDELSNAKYRRTPPPRRPPPGRLPTGRRLVVLVVAMALLAALALATVTIGSGDDGGSGATTTAAAPPVTGGRAPDVVVARSLLPAASGFGPDWVEVTREADPVSATVDETDVCATRGQPIQRGLVVRAAFNRVRAATILEQASMVAGVVEAGTPVPRLDAPDVAACLQEGIEAQVTEGASVVAVDQPLPATPDGAELTGARFEVRATDGTVNGWFDMLLLRRDRAVSFLLLAVQDAEAATPLDTLVQALDAPLAAGARRLN